MTEDPFVAHRSLLFTIAYEMLGSAADAEDVLQEAWLRLGVVTGCGVGGEELVGGVVGVRVGVGACVR